MCADKPSSEAFARISAWRALLKPVERQRRRLGITTASVGLVAIILTAAAAAFLGSGLAHDNSGMWEFLRGEAGKPARRDFPGLIALSDPPVVAAPRHRHRHAIVASVPVLEKRAVCVRLCDGYFFPMGNVHGAAVNLADQEAMCSRTCPGAPSHVYVLPAGSDKIEQASTPDGRLYSALPVAFRHTQTADNTCSCQPSNERQLMSLMKDFTLRPGDAVATSTGVRVFKGAAHWPYRSKDFLSLVEARSFKLSSAALTAIEKAIKRPQEWQVRFTAGSSAPPEEPRPAGESAKDPAGKQVRVINVDTRM